jgi:hypothetical protein
MKRRLLSATLTVLLFSAVSLPLFGDCLAHCAQQGTLWEHCTDIVGGQGDMADCSDVDQCMICVDYYSGEPYVCCLPTCKGHICLIG